MTMSPTARSLQHCKKLGWTADVVERRLTRNIKKDFLGCIDIIAVVPAGHVVVSVDSNKGHITLGDTRGEFVGIQATSGSNHSARVAKIHAEPRIQRWLDAGGKVEVWSWAKRGARGKRKRWELRRTEVVL